jgi:hypothetical protein
VVVQEAAKRVLNENRDLRIILSLQGFSDQDIAAKLAMLRASASAGGVLTTMTQSESLLVPAPTPSQQVSQPTVSFESLLREEAWTDTPFKLYASGQEYPDQFSAVYAPLGADPFWDLGVPADGGFSATMTSPQPEPLPADEQTFPTLYNNSSSPEVDSICCPPFLPSPSSPSTHGSGSLESSHIPTSTPCTVAYSLLTALNSRRQQQQDMFLITLELLSGFRGAPEGDPEGCRVDNSVLITVMGKLFE